MTRPPLRAIGSALLTALLLASGSAAADWMANADFTTCPRQYVPNTHGQDGPFATKEQCEARIAQVQRESPMVCARYSCDENGGSSGGGAGGGKPKPGHELDKNINDAINAGLQGKISAGDTVGLVSMGVLGNALLGGMAEDSPEEKARKAARRQAKREARAAAAAQAAAAADAHAQGLLGEMLDTDDEDDDEEDLAPGAAPSAPSPSPVASFAPGSTPHWTATAPNPPPQPTTGELGMLMDDNVPTTGAAPAPAVAPTNTAQQGFMPNRRPAQPVRNEPRAVIKQPAAAGCDGGALAGMMCDEDPPVPPAPLPPAPNPPQPNPPPNNPLIDGYTKGFEHGSGCYSQNAGPACSGSSPDTFDICVDGYRRGYQVGERAKNMNLDQAYRAGQQAKANGEMNNGASQAGAVGTCRIEWIKAYNSGYSGAPHP